MKKSFWLRQSENAVIVFITAFIMGLGIMLGPAHHSWVWLVIIAAIVSSLLLSIHDIFYFKAIDKMAEKIKKDLTKDYSMVKVELRYSRGDTHVYILINKDEIDEEV